MQATQSEEVRRVKAELRQVSEDRKNPEEAAEHFAKQSGLSTRSNRPLVPGMASGKVPIHLAWPTLAVEPA